jgi:hypothetical protein
VSAHPEPVVVTPETVLRLQARRVLQREEVGADGRPALRMIYGEHQVTFEDAELSFGRRLVCESAFRAVEACSWSDGTPRSWSDVHALLSELVVAGVLELDGRPAAGLDEPPSVLQRIDPKEPMPPLAWHSLDDLCALVAAGGHVLPVDVLEATLGAGLLAQLVRDPSGRQCGENTLAMSAPQLTDRVPTEWRRCRFAGSRFEDRRPMNVSGLRQVAADFDGMLARIAAVRAAFLARTGRTRLDLGSMWLLAWIFFVLPAWTVRRAADRGANGEVPEWATALSKTFGGIRMTLQMLLLQHGRALTSEITAAEFLRVTEEAARYLSRTGVCAATPMMLERTVNTFVAGGCPRAAAPIPHLDQALDYGVATAALPLLAAARETRTRLLVAAAGLDGPIARELADVEDREGDARNALGRACQLGAALGVAIDPVAPPLVPSEPLPDPADLLLAVLGVEAKAVRLAGHHQARVNTVLGVPSTPPLTRRDVAAGLSPTPRRLWGDLLAEHLGWSIDDNGNGLAVRAGNRHIPVRPPLVA